VNRLRLAVLCDARDEGWPSMELVGEMLLSALEGPLSPEVEVTALRPSLPRLARRLPGLPPRLALNADRFAGRYLALPVHARRLARRDAYHVVDHSYAHLARSLPAGRTGVYCHDADAFRSLFDPRERRPAWFRALARHVLSGLQRAAVVFHSTQGVRAELIQHGLVDPARLVHAPYGVAPEFNAAAEAPSPPERRYLLHVGSAAPRKRLDVLLDVFARVRREVPDLQLVQVGAPLSPALRAQVDRLGLSASLTQPPPLPRAGLAALYRGATLVLLPSDSEGFGLPALEALACGAPVIATDLPVLREVAGDAALYAPPGAVDAWADLVLRALDGRTPLPPREKRLDQVKPFTWEAHARAILRAYQRIQ
jgi:glycosyltransferase involved in cell wall biosynthesis